MSAKVRDIVENYYNDILQDQKYIDVALKLTAYGYCRGNFAINKYTEVPQIIFILCAIYCNEPSLNHLKINEKYIITSKVATLYRKIDNYQLSGIVLEEGDEFEILDLNIKENRSINHNRYIFIKYIGNTRTDEDGDEEFDLVPGTQGWIDVKSASLYRPSMYDYINRHKVVFFKINKAKNKVHIYPTLKSFGCHGYESSRKVESLYWIPPDDQICLIAPAVDDLRCKDTICVWSFSKKQLCWIECENTTFLTDLKGAVGINIFGKVVSNYGENGYLELNPPIPLGRVNKNETVELVSKTGKYVQRVDETFIHVKCVDIDARIPNRVVWIRLLSTDIDQGIIQIQDNH